MSLQVIQSGRPRTAILSGKSLGVSLREKEITANYGVQPTDDIIGAWASAGAITVYLGSYVDRLPEKLLLIKKTDSSSNVVTVNVSDESGFDEKNNNWYLRKQYDSILIYGSNERNKWMIFAERRANKTANKITLPAPTISGWTTAPAPLSEITNDDYGAFATAGAVTTASAWGHFNFDLGEIYTLSLAVYSAITNVDLINIHLSLDNTTFYKVGIDNIIEGEGGNAKIVNVTGTGRYVRIGYQNQSAGTLSLTNCSISAIGAPIV